MVSASDLASPNCLDRAAAATSIGAIADDVAGGWTSSGGHGASSTWMMYSITRSGITGSSKDFLPPSISPTQHVGGRDQLG